MKWLLTTSFKEYFIQHSQLVNIAILFIQFENFSNKCWDIKIIYVEVGKSDK